MDLELGDLGAEAARILQGYDPLPEVGDDILRKQAECRLAEDEAALALWSRVRWLWLQAMGRVRPDTTPIERVAGHMGLASNTADVPLK